MDYLRPQLMEDIYFKKDEVTLTDSQRNELNKIQRNQLKSDVAESLCELVDD